MTRKMAFSLGLGALAAAGMMTMLPSIASAAPTYCVQQAWNYADEASGGASRTSPEWQAYNSAFQQYNHCYQPDACNDITIPCQYPPM